MIRLKNILPTAFLMGIVELVDMEGAGKTYEWINSIGIKLAEIEGPGFEGARENGINYLPIYPFASELIDFINILGETPSQFSEVISFCNKLRDESENPWDYPAITTILGLLEHSYTKKRAEMAGAKVYNVGSKSPFDESREYNADAMKKAGMSQKEVDVFLDKAYCVYKIEYPEEV